MDTVIANSDLSNISNNLFGFIGQFSYENFELTEGLFEEAEKLCNALNIKVIQLIEMVDKTPYEEIGNLRGLLLLAPAVIFMKDTKIKPKSKKQEILLSKYSPTIHKYESTMSMFSDFIDALEQYFEDSGKHKLSTYLRLIDEYRADRDEYLKIAEEFIHADLEKWE